MVAYAFNPITWLAEAKNLWVQDQLGIKSEFQDSQVYTEKPSLKKIIKQTNKQTNKKHLFYEEDRAQCTHIVAYNLCTATVLENHCSLSASVGHRLINEREGMSTLAHKGEKGAGQPST